MHKLLPEGFNSDNAVSFHSARIIPVQLSSCPDLVPLSLYAISVLICLIEVSAFLFFVPYLFVLILYNLHRWTIDYTPRRAPIQSCRNEVLQKLSKSIMAKV